MGTAPRSWPVPLVLARAALACTHQTGCGAAALPGSWAEWTPEAQHRMKSDRHMKPELVGPSDVQCQCQDL